jgi:hypothetical protein
MIAWSYKVRIFTILLCIGLAVGISIYDLTNPPAKEITLSEWKQDAEGKSVIFQHFPLEILEIMSGDYVRFADMEGTEIVCKAHPSLETHPALQSERWASAEIVIKDSQCYIMRSAVRSGHRLVKLTVSLIVVLVVIALLFKDSKLDLKEMVFMRRDNNA